MSVTPRWWIGGAAWIVAAGCQLISGVSQWTYVGAGGGATATAQGGGIGPGCGDGVKNGAEACDKTDVGPVTCASAVGPGWIGAVGCTAACTLDLTGCKTPATTYNDVANGANWASFDVATVNAAAKEFLGAAFDGRYVYLVPSSNVAPERIVARFDAKSPAWLPKGWNASFF